MTNVRSWRTVWKAAHQNGSSHDMERSLARNQPKRGAKDEFSDEESAAICNPWRMSRPVTAELSKTAEKATIMYCQQRTKRRSIGASNDAAFHFTSWSKPAIDNLPN